MSGVTSHSLHRHILHHYPFFPLDSSTSSSLPPSPPPQPPPQPKYPFSSSSSPYPFFPSDPPPPPSSPSSIASFPANVSSLIFPNSSHRQHKPISTILIATSLSASLLLVALLVIILQRRRRNVVVSHKPLRPENSTHSPSPTGTTTRTTTSDGTVKLIPPTLRSGRGTIGTSTEFLYLGTVAATSSTSGINSPELRPLPPLPKFANHFPSAEQISPSTKIEEEVDDDEEFFSPRQSSSGSRTVHGFVDDRSRGFNSKTASFPSSNSTSPTLIVSDRKNQLLIPHSPSLPSSSSPDIERGRLCVEKTQSQQKVSNLHPPPLPPSFLNDGLEDSRMEALGLMRNQQTLKLKLKPLHWEKLRASSEKPMAWDDIKSSSFVLNEEMIESMFLAKSTNLVSNDKRCWNVLPSTNQENVVLDLRKSQNIAILLRAMNVTTDEVCEALLEGNLDALGSEMLESLLKMAPNMEEERSLRDFNDESAFKLGPAERFLKILLEIPLVFERVNAMLYITSFDSEVEYLTQSFQILLAACAELKSSKMFLKLLEAVLKAGNRMNVGTKRGDALAFKLDTLLKLVDVKGTDGKTTLLDFVVQEIIRDEDPMFNQGIPLGSQDEVESRKRSLQVVTSLIGELSNVKKAAEIDFRILSSEVEKLANQISKVRHVLKLVEEIPMDIHICKFTESVTEFLNKADVEIARIQIQQNTAFALVKEVTEYFHGDSSKEEANPFRIFLVVRDFLSILDRVCKDVGKRHMRTILGSGSVHSSYHPNRNPSPLFPQFNHMQQSLSYGDQRSYSLNYGLAHSSSI